jgi:hypothetical protein
MARGGYRCWPCMVMLRQCKAGCISRWGGGVPPKGAASAFWSLAHLLPFTHSESVLCRQVVVCSSAADVGLMGTRLLAVMSMALTPESNVLNLGQSLSHLLDGLACLEEAPLSLCRATCFGIVGIRGLSVCGPHFFVGGWRLPAPKWELLAPAANASMSSRLFFLCALGH